MAIDQRRKPAYDLLVSITKLMKKHHLEITEKIIVILPEAKNRVTEHHKAYCNELDSLVKRAANPRAEDDEPVWQTLRLVCSPPIVDDFDVDAHLCDEIERRFGIQS